MCVNSNAKRGLQPGHLGLCVQELCFNWFFFFFFFALFLDWLLLCNIDFVFSIDEQDEMIKKERSVCQQTWALLHKNFLRKWRMKKESALVWFTKKYISFHI